MEILVAKQEGIYCPPGDFYIDPMRSVSRALITHGHSDHARTGSKNYLTQENGVGILKHRLGEKSNIEGISYRKQIKIGDALVSFHPAGHILGSSQIRIEVKGEVWVISGDYKTKPDRTCPEFEPVPCNVFVTESTFALPVYHWKDDEEIFREILFYWEQNRKEKHSTILYAYSLGKTQRILSGLDEKFGNIFLEEQGFQITKAYEKEGIRFPSHFSLKDLDQKHKGTYPLLIVTPGKDLSPWKEILGECRGRMASGWMRANAENPFYPDGFVLSDHADWNGLNEAVKTSGAERIIVMHGFTKDWIRFLKEKGKHAEEFSSFSKRTET
ncbi:ligase-associated DNA damage response exonuclease [Leptospira idonii]|uniref:Ligase-associated DNA damage response exonuclease n=1 Tax=Leptospira idonii TaxID=1193500 RepID=A0A4R9LUY0_9LEPT|nr:ligase-associated DNA damage response exonuclease [Leptospira idonii]TGN17888.1 ligase-associated DNA damage response exonuclease [Leptospira idonii]